MNATLFYSIQSEWMKTKRSAAFWLVIIGGLFIPGILTLMYLVYIKRLGGVFAVEKFWEKWLINGWESMSIFFLPMGIVLATSLIAQLEYKNNGWKQVHTTPQSLTTVFVAKYTVVLLLMLQLFVLFGLGMCLAGSIPAWYYGHIPYPKEAFPWGRFIQINASFYVMALPIVALQFLLSIQFKNFMVSLGAGVALVAASIMVLTWRYVYLVPYTYGAIHLLQLGGKMRFKSNILDLHYLALIYFIGFTLISYILYLTKKEKG